MNRRLIRLGAISSTSLVVLGAQALPAGATGWGNGFICPPKAICVGIRVGGEYQGGSGGGTEWGRYYYVYERAEVWDPACPGAQAYLMSRVDRGTGDVVFQDGPVCLNPGEPPTPPSPAEVWDRVTIPLPGIRVNPSAEGMTGLQTWVWYEGSGEVTVTVTLRGYTVTASAKPTKFHWGMGDGASYSTPNPGNEANPSATHSYETKADYPLTLETSWEGTWSMSGWGISESGLPLGTIVVSNQRNYHVIEVRSVLDG